MDKKYENLSMDEVSFNGYNGVNILEKFIDISLPNEQLDFKYIKVLNYLLDNPEKIADDIKNSLKGSNVIETRSFYRHINELCNKYKLIEVVTEKVELLKGTKTKYKKPYRLSLNGIFYVILNTFDITYDQLIKGLSKNYSNNIIFSFFLYPHISKDTINEISDNGFFSYITLYLRDICKVIINSLQKINNTINVSSDGYIINLLFVWPNNNDKNKKINWEDYSKLYSFLIRRLNWVWIKNVKTTPNFEENRIDMINSQDHTKNASISIIKSEKAILKQQGQKIKEFSVVDNDIFLSIETESEYKMIDDENMLKYKSEEYLYILITKLRTQITKHMVSFDILSNDTIFKCAMANIEKAVKIRQ